MKLTNIQQNVTITKSEYCPGPEDKQTEISVPLAHKANTPEIQPPATFFEHSNTRIYKASMKSYAELQGAKYY